MWLPRLAIVTVNLQMTDWRTERCSFAVSHGQQRYLIIEINKPLTGPGIMRVGCSTHQWMRGWIVSTDEASAVSAADGSFTIADVPPGTYQLRVWHEALKVATQPVTVTAGKTVEVTFEAR